MRMSWLLCLILPAHAQAQNLDLVLPPLGFQRVAWTEIRVTDMRQRLARAGVSLAAFEREDRNKFRIVDIDLDGRGDIVFNGGRCAGCEGVETRIYRDAGTRFDLAVFPDEVVYAVGRQAPDQTPSLVLRDQPFGMCDVSDHSLRFYRRSSPPDTALYQQYDEVRFLDLPGSRWPQAALPAPIRVRVAQDQYNLRAAPIVDDSTRHDDCAEHRGNVFAAFRVGTTALALAQQQVGPRLWYFVMTDPGSTITSPGSQESQASQARLVGWMSSRFLEPVEPRNP